MKRAAMMLLLCIASGEAAAGARLLVISGIGGEERFSEQFKQWSIAMLDAARDRLELAAEDVTWLCESPARAPGRCSGESRREAVLSAVRRSVTAPPAQAPVMLLLIGHGTARDDRVRFNLPGPDLSPEDLLDALSGAGNRPVAVVNTSPASAPFVATLSHPSRVVITATAHASEEDHTRFAGAFVAAWSGDAADRDRDGRVSLLEAFDHAARAVAAGYKVAGELVTEHALLDDDGDGLGSREPGTEAGDGATAAGFYLAALPSAVRSSPDALALEAQARALLAQIATLRRARTAMEPSRYDEVLEALLVGLALNRRAARALGS